MTRKDLNLIFLLKFSNFHFRNIPDWIFNIGNIGPLKGPHNPRWQTYNVWKTFFVCHWWSCNRSYLFQGKILRRNTEVSRKIFFYLSTVTSLRFLTWFPSWVFTQWWLARCNRLLTAFFLSIFHEPHKRRRNVWKLWRT
jgi:hypothetical protein